MRLTILFLSITVFSLSSLSYGADACTPQPNDKSCFTCSKAPVDFSYCVTQDEGSHNPDVLYYLHGITFNEKTWRRKDFYPEMIRQVWKYENVEAPTVISVSFGPTWLLVDQNTSPKSGLLDVFLKAVMPRVEAGIGGVKGKRLLIGESMGGFNATQLVLKAPGEFSKAAILCPAITAVSPYATPDEVKAYIARNKADPKKVALALQVSKYFVPDATTWDAIAPLSQAATRLNDRTPDMYLSCGSSDEYGFYEGVAKFADIASKNLNHFTWHPIFMGPHCSVDAGSVAHFLVN